MLPSANVVGSRGYSSRRNASNPLYSGNSAGGLFTKNASSTTKSRNAPPRSVDYFTSGYSSNHINRSQHLPPRDILQNKYSFVDRAYRFIFGLPPSKSQSSQANHDSGSIPVDLASRSISNRSAGSGDYSSRNRSNRQPSSHSNNNKPINPNIYSSNTNSISKRSLKPRHDVSDQFLVDTQGNSTSGNKQIKMYFGEASVHGLNVIVDTDGVLRFRIRKGPNKEESGKDMFLSAMKRLKKEHCSVKEIDGTWEVQSDSVNTEEFCANIKKGMSPEAAARETWTGRLARNLGYTEVVSVSEDREYIRARFVKPNLATVASTEKQCQKCA